MWLAMEQLVRRKTWSDSTIFQHWRTRSTHGKFAVTRGHYWYWCSQYARWNALPIVVCSIVVHVMCAVVGSHWFDLLLSVSSRLCHTLQSISFWVKLLENNLSSQVPATVPPNLKYSFCKFVQHNGGDRREWAYMRFLLLCASQRRVRIKMWMSACKVKIWNTPTRMSVIKNYSSHIQPYAHSFARTQSQSLNCKHSK